MGGGGRHRAAVEFPRLLWVLAQAKARARAPRAHKSMSKYLVHASCCTLGQAMQAVGRAVTTKSARSCDELLSVERGGWRAVGSARAAVSHSQRSRRCQLCSQTCAVCPGLRKARAQGWGEAGPCDVQSLGAGPTRTSTWNSRWRRQGKGPARGCAATHCGKPSPPPATHHTHAPAGPPPARPPPCPIHASACHPNPRAGSWRFWTATSRTCASWTSSSTSTKPTTYWTSCWWRVRERHGRGGAWAGAGAGDGRWGLGRGSKEAGSLGL